MKIGIIKERKSPPDRRVVFSPDELVDVQNVFPHVKVKVESSDIRVFPDEEYLDKCFEVSNDMSDCDVLIGVKEVPIGALIPNKQYFFFSHTIKRQPYNRDLLRAILDKNITLYDHETLVDRQGGRLVGFGRYAGIVGAYNGMRTWGLKKSLFDLPKAENLEDQQALINELRKVELGPIKIVLTGSGKVAKGAQEMLDAMDIKRVSVNDFLDESFTEPVYVMIDVLDYNKRKDGQVIDNIDFYQNPEHYDSDFEKFTKKADLFIAGHFFGDGSPYILTQEMLKSEGNTIQVVADISCDIAGPIACTIRPSTIADPIYGYDPESGQETDYRAEKAIAVMAVDNLPCELPKDASEGFGEMFKTEVLPALFNDDRSGILERAKITDGGKLTERFSYLQDFVDGK